MQLSTLLAVAAGIQVTSAACNQDNCYRQFTNYFTNPASSSKISTFCATYTQTVNTATTSLPTYVSHCASAPSRISSACSCLFTPNSSTTRTTSAPISVTSSSSTTSPTSTSTSSSTSSSTPTSTSSTSSSTSSDSSTTSSTTSSSTSSTTSDSSITSSSSSAPTSTPGPKICMNPQLSCHNTTAIADLCCFNAPGGSLLQTQFWDTSPSTGPADHWTVHGLWPDHCDGTYDQFCDMSRQYTNITAILQSFGKTDLLAYMNTYWKDYQGHDESFWEHEWGKHGTCISTLDTNCYTDYQPQQEVVDFFQTTVDSFKSLDSYAFLAAAGIVPSTTVTYTSAQIYSALSAAYGFEPAIECSSGALDEIYYYYNVLGSIQTGEFVKTYPDDNSTSCPATGIKYLPKYQTATTTTGTATSTSTPTGTPTPTIPYSGKGYLNAYTGGALTGCLISAGTWYTTGTCAGYTSAFIDATNTTFTLKSSKGACGVANNIFTCSATAPSSLFTVIDGYLGYSGSNLFYAAAVPVGAVQQPVYTTTNTTTVQFLWQGL